MEKENYKDLMSKLQVDEDNLKIKMNDISAKKRELATAYAETIEKTFPAKHGQKVKIIFSKRDEGGRQRAVIGFYSGVHFNNTYKFFPTLYKVKKDGTLSKNLYMNCDLPEMSEIVKVEDIDGNVSHEYAVASEV